jgi:hypothetical protein
METTLLLIRRLSHLFPLQSIASCGMAFALQLLCWSWEDAMVLKRLIETRPLSYPPAYQRKEPFLAPHSGNRVLRNVRLSSIGIDADFG